MHYMIAADPNLTAWLGFFGTVIVGLLGFIGVMLNRTRQHARATRDQVENDHTSNFREEQDVYHNEVMRTLARHGDLMVVQAATLERLERADGRHSKRLNILEDALHIH